MQLLMNSQAGVKVDSIHMQIPSSLLSLRKLVRIGACRGSVYVDLQGFCFNDSPPETIPSTVLVTPYQPDIK